MKKEIYFCDVCEFEKKINKKVIEVVFTTEQTEGRGITPYLSLEKMDICAGCEDKILAGGCLMGSGAQGHNQFYFKTEAE